MIKIPMQGLKELDRALNQLPKRVENRVLQKATREAMRAILPEMRAAAPQSAGERSPASQEYGTLKSNIKLANKRNKRKGSRGAVIDTRDAFWGYFLEFGTRSIPARPWFLPAFTAAKDKALATLKDAIGRGVEREFKDLT